MRVAIGQPRLRVGDVRYNAERIAQCLDEARRRGAETVLLGRMALLGGVWLPDWNVAEGLQAQEDALEYLRPHCAGLLVVMGLAVEVQGDMRSAMYVAQREGAEGGQVLMPGQRGQVMLGDVAWTLLAGDASELSCGGRNNGLAGDDEATTAQLFVRLAPHSMLGEETDVTAGWPADMPPLLTVRHAGVLDHHVETRGVEMAARGVVNRLEGESDGLYLFDAHDVPKLCQRASCKMSDTQEPYELLVRGLRDFFAAQGLRRALVGLSGGIDSAVVLAIAVEALGAENVMAVFMPSQYSSQASAEDAQTLAQNLGVEYHVVPIDAVCRGVEGALGALLQGKRDTTEENIQARARGLMLMAIANKRGCALLNTSNRSEAAVGYSTLYGDMCGAVAVIGDLYKGQVYEAARWVNRAGSVIPERIITRAPSAELREGQTDQDSLPEYDVLDAILMALLEERASLSCLVARGFDAEIVQRVMQLVQGSAFKRVQMPPILKVSHSGFQRPVSSWPLGAKWPRW